MFFSLNTLSQRFMQFRTNTRFGEYDEGNEFCEVKSFLLIKGD